MDMMITQRDEIGNPRSIWRRKNSLFFPPRPSTTSTKYSWSSGVHRRRGFSDFWYFRTPVFLEFFMFFTFTSCRSSNKRTLKKEYMHIYVYKYKWIRLLLHLIWKQHQPWNVFCVSKVNDFFRKRILLLKHILIIYSYVIICKNSSSSSFSFWLDICWTFPLV